MGTKKVLVIAEAGVNHNGSLFIAKQLADVAIEAGADVVKYQVFDSRSLVARGAEKAEYQKRTTDANETQEEMLRRLELSHDEFRELKNHCERIGIKFLATPFDICSTRFLVEDLGIDLIKVPSGEMDNWPFLVSAASYGLPIVMSTGMSSLEEVLASVNVLRENGAKDITVLHCNTQYPTPFGDVNLNAMPELGRICKCAYGYSDHTPGIEVPIAATALGASIVEKHFTLDKSMNGPDHRASLEPSELKAMVAAIRNIELALGDSEKQVTFSEMENRRIARKSIRASRFIEKGEILDESNLTTKRPGDGLSPMRWPEVIGTRAMRSFKEDEGIEI